MRSWIMPDNGTIRIRKVKHHMLLGIWSCLPGTSSIDVPGSLNCAPELQSPPTGEGTGFRSQGGCEWLRSSRWVFSSSAMASNLLASIYMVILLIPIDSSLYAFVCHHDAPW